MVDFPRTTVGGLSVSRMIIGTNWILGFSHKSVPQDRIIHHLATRQNIADLLEVYLRAGVDTMLGSRTEPKLQDACKDAEDRTGRGLIHIGTPSFKDLNGPGLKDEVARACEEYRKFGTRIFMPHQSTTDALTDKSTRTIRRGDEIVKVIREHGLIPGLSNHHPESVIYADETNLDVETYIMIYNAIGFLMQLEVEWAHRIILEAKKPVITIKPMAAGRLTPLAGLPFAWSTIRKCDMVAVGAMSPDEAKELVDISLALIEGRYPLFELQRTRSKQSVEKKK